MGSDGPAVFEEQNRNNGLRGIRGGGGSEYSPPESNRREIPLEIQKRTADATDCIAGSTSNTGASTVEVVKE